MRSWITSVAAVPFLLGLVLTAMVPGASRVEGAEIAANFSLPFRTNSSKTFRLHDYPGQVILFECFFYWCPHCQAATPQVHTNIINYYAAQNGNPDGVPVTVVYANMENRAGADQIGTDAFITANDMKSVLNDFSFTIYFTFGGEGTPHFVIINTVTNSSSHQPWEIIYKGSGFDASTTINTLRSKIDSVRAANRSPRLDSPRLLEDGSFEFVLKGQNGRVNVIEGTSDWASWSTVTNLTLSNGLATFRYRDPPGQNSRLYRARVQ